MVTIFWFRRDLRLNDNAGLFEALKNHKNVYPLFIFDRTILDQLPSNDFRVPFIHSAIENLKTKLQSLGSDLCVEYGDPIEIFKQLLQKLQIQAVYTNHDYEPQAILRDFKVLEILKTHQIEFHTFKDHVIFEKDEIKTDQNNPYTVYTPYKKKWLNSLSSFYLKSYPVDLYQSHFYKFQIKPSDVQSLHLLGFKESSLLFPEAALSFQQLSRYAENRDYPALDETSKLGVHLRFGTVSVRELAREGLKHSDVWLSELIWRDFFTQILFHFPFVEKTSFRPAYDQIKWVNNPSDFERWCQGETGYPLVDAGMRQLNTTGYMHNRVRMVVASFLTKHLLTHWSFGERYFASKLLDYDLAANNGNWQWAAGTGCDAAPYFRVFNPQAQLEKFDPKFEYVLKWVPEIKSGRKIEPIIQHEFARKRALEVYKAGLKK